MQQATRGQRVGSAFVLRWKNTTQGARKAKIPKENAFSMCTPETRGLRG